jgi:hypothetical protein
VPTEIIRITPKPRVVWFIHAAGSTQTKRRFSNKAKPLLVSGEL